MFGMEKKPAIVPSPKKPHKPVRVVMRAQILKEPTNEIGLRLYIPDTFVHPDGLGKWSCPICHETRWLQHHCKKCGFPVKPVLIPRERP